MPTPTGKTQAQALAFVRSITNESSLPSDATVLGFINDGLEQVVTELNALYRVGNVLTSAGATTVQLPADVQQIYKLTYSTLLPTQAGVIEYPMSELGPAGFVDQTGSNPTVMGGPVIFYRLVEDDTNQITIQIFPLSPGGYINVYYSPRVNQYDPENGSSTTNLDSAYIMAALYWAAARVCENRENFKRVDYFEKKYEALILKERSTIKERRARKGAQVRDVTAGPTVMPAWFPR